MPIPKPLKDESKSDFIKRFMSDKEMKDEFPTKTDNNKNQRIAVALSQWNKYSKIKEHLYIESFDLFKDLSQ